MTPPSLHPPPQLVAPPNHNNRVEVPWQPPSQSTRRWRLPSHQDVGGFQVIKTLLQRSHVPTTAIDPQVDDPKMPVHIQVPTLRTKEMVVQQESSPLVILVQILDPLPLLEHAGFNAIPLSRVVNSEVNQESVQRLTLVVSLSKRDHTRSVMAAEYLIALVEASKARSLGLGSTTP